MKIRNLQRTASPATPQQAANGGAAKRSFCLLLAALLMAATSLWAQDLNVSGTVRDSNGEPVVGASVVVKGSTVGVTTDVSGGYTISAPANATLVFSFLGLTAKEEAVAGRGRVDVTLEESDQAIDEVVVVGYGVQRKSDVTGAMARVGEKELQSMPVKDALQAMQGKTAGVDITSNQRPGQTGSISIRGIRSISAEQGPLYVVDGMVIQGSGSGTVPGSGIDNINPDDIESIDILKDASATAIYGSRGANGVILVSTKRGKKGALSINYSGSVTLDKMYDVTEYMNTAEWIEYARIAKINNGTYSSPTPSYEADHAIWGSIAASWANIAAGWTNNNTVWDGSLAGNYDWAANGKQNAVSTEHTLSISGGGDRSQSYGSFGYLKQEGTQPGQDFERYTAKVSFDATPQQWFSMGTAINGSWGNQDYGYNFAKSVTGAGDYYNALKGMLPWAVPYDENGDFIRNPAAGDVNIINPIDELKYTVNNRQTFTVNGSFYAQLDFGEMFEPLRGLKFRTQFGPEFRYYRTGVFYDAKGINGDGNNTASYNTNQTRAWTLDNLVYYDRSLGTEHKLGLTLMQSASAYHYENGDMKSIGTASAEELWYNLYSAGKINSFGTGLTERQMESYLVRGNYSFRDRYLLTASMRWDGASQLAEGHKWASFPSVALGWRIEQEEFMQEVKFINMLKLRLGVGVTGNAAINAYATKGGLTQVYYNWGAKESSPGYVASDPSASSPAKMANPALSWERTTQYNVGLDYGFLKGRINGSIDVYQTKTNDLLLSMSIPSLLGYTSTYANVGKTEGWGVDLQLNTVNIQTNDFSWLTSLTWSKDKNKIVELANGNKEDVNNRWFVGEEIQVYYDYVYDGIWKTSEAEAAATFSRKPGQIRVKDISGPDGVPDGKIDANYDKQIVGYQRPKWTGGMLNTFSYKNFELSFFLFSRWGFNFASGALTLDGRYQQRKIDYWVAGTNEDAKYYSPGSNSEAADTYSSSMNYQDGSFIKLRNVNLGYKFNPKQLGKVGIADLKVYVQLMNPATLYSKCDYLDTDLLNYDNNTTSSGSSTTIKGMVFGINIGF